ncbi:rCG41971 [Rattus norvegicus]|uniref:RCG41971 n=1 Tax=Rattus norvegicus TaxID=10116 RepID=A6JV10_RAT|nr:rCG41971 [Rattus norvegicus]
MNHLESKAHDLQ